MTVSQEGNRQVQRNIVHYNLDMIIALGYRVQSQVAVRFRRWATQRLHEYIQEGFAMDDERLKHGGKCLHLGGKCKNLIDSAELRTFFCYFCAKRSSYDDR